MELLVQYQHYCGGNMDIDKIDIQIINILLNLKPREIVNIYSITQKVFETNDEYVVRKKYNLIKNRIKKLSRYGLIKIFGEDVKIFKLQVQKINHSEIKCSKEFKKVMGLYIDDSWVYFEC